MFLFVRVDPLYAFFVQWSPEIYGSDDEIKPEERGFVVIDDDDSDDDIDMIEDHYQSEGSSRRLQRHMSKDWEVSDLRILYILKTFKIIFYIFSSIKKVLIVFFIFASHKKKMKNCMWDI